MMNYHTLDKQLHRLTKKEIEFKKRADNVGSSGIPHYTQPLLFDIQCNPSHPDIGNYKDFLIIPHTRFSIVPDHCHNYVELAYVYSGSVHQTIDGQSVILKKGQIVLIDTGISHSIDMTGENDIMINILLTRDFLSFPFLSNFNTDSIISNFFANTISDTASHNNYIIFHSENSRRIDLYFKEILCENLSSSPNAKQIIEKFLVLAFLELLNVYSRDVCIRADWNAGSLIFPVLQYIKKNYNTCTLKSTASFFHLNPNYLSALLKKNVGKTYKQIVTNEKITNSAYLLTHTSLPIYEIANTAGYENLSFFFGKFKEYYGMTPQEYRDQHRLSDSASTGK